MKQEMQSHPLQEEQTACKQPKRREIRPRYQSPQIIVYGTVLQLTKGSGGEYDDECTSGKQPGDDE